MWLTIPVIRALGQKVTEVVVRRVESNRGAFNCGTGRKNRRGAAPNLAMLLRESRLWGAVVERGSFAVQAGGERRRDRTENTRREEQ